MANYTANISVGKKVYSFEIEKASSVHVAKHMLIQTKNTLKDMSFSAQILRWSWVDEGDECVAKEPEVIFSI